MILSLWIIVAGCSSPAEKRAKSLSRVKQLQAAGEAIAALQLLEELSQTYPDDSEILQRIGLTQQDLSNYTEALFYLSAAYNLSPENSELLYQTYLASEDANQPETALELLEIFSTTNASAMTNTQWFRLGELYVQYQKTESALAAYLEGVKLTDEEPTPETALAIGTLYKQLDNLPMAGRWLGNVANSDDPNALPALFGLLEIHLRTKNWETAEKCITLLDKKFPGAMDASDWAKARVELKEWRAAQAEMKARLEKIAQAEREAEARKKAQTKAQVQPEPTKTSDDTETTQKTFVETSGKAQIVTDMKAAEALASEPATPEKSETVPEAAPKTSEEPTESEIVFNPNILIQPAEPEVEFQEADDSQNQDASVFIDSSDNYQSSKTSSDLSQETISVLETPTEPEVSTEPIVSVLDVARLSLEELIARADASTSRRDYEEAIQLYWSALGQTNQRADVWNALSEVYLKNGQAKNAATTALEATRLSPENIDYLLDYLRVVQRVKKPADFIKELEIAYERFPRSPEIALSLARGYHKISGDEYAASILYRRFIQMAPKHPLRREAEIALERMR